MTPLLSGTGLAALAASHPGLEEFGPGAETTHLAIELEEGEAKLGPWLTTLPCPVIGIGQGPLAPFCDLVLETAAPLAEISQNIQAAPLAAMVLVQHLRMSATLSPEHALTAESFAYATLQTGPEFRSWRQSRPLPAPLPQENTPALLIRRDGTALRLTLNRPLTRNAIGVELRDALSEAFDFTALDQTIAEITLDALGSCFSTGGEVAEFGLAPDSATAHWVRSLRLPARKLLPIREKLTVRVDGAAIGAGIEIAAFAQHLVASRKAWFQLPELKYGLIPGAGGTVSLPRRIGRQRVAYMALSMRRIPAATALSWGLVDALA